MESPDGAVVTESIVFMATTTPGIVGEYVAACAQRKCKYFGTFFQTTQQFHPRQLILVFSVLIERFYAKRGLPVRAYPLRGMDLCFKLSSSLISLSSNDVAMGAPPPPPINFDVEAFEQQQQDMETTPTRTRAPRRPRAPGKYFIFS